MHSKNHLKYYKYFKTTSLLFDLIDEGKVAIKKKPSQMRRLFRILKSYYNAVTVNLEPSFTTLIIL